MAKQDPGMEEFNAMGVSAPVPGEESTYDPPNDQQAELVTPEAPEVPAEPLPEPRQIIDELFVEQERADRKQSFAQKKFAAEQQEQARRAAALAEIERIEGLAELGRLLEQNTDLGQRVGGVIQQHFQENQQAALTTYSPSTPSQQAAPQTAGEIAQLRQQVAELSRGVSKSAVNAATQNVQGRYHITQEDMAAVVLDAVRKGRLTPGLSQAEYEERLEDSRKVVFFDRAKSIGKDDLLQKVATAQKAVTAQGAAGEGATRKPYDTTGRTFAEVRRDAKLAGAKGL